MNAKPITDRRRPQTGLTLIELVTVLLVFCVLAAVALPAIQSLLTRSRVGSAQMSFMAGLNAARGFAISLRSRIIFCPTRDGRQCSNEAAWSSGWLIGQDNDRNNQPDLAPLRAELTGSSRLIISSSNSRRRVIFQANGSAAGSTITISICDPSGRANALNVIVANSGRVRGAQGNASQIASCRAGS